MMTLVRFSSLILLYNVLKSFNFDHINILGDIKSSTSFFSFFYLPWLNKKRNSPAKRFTNTLNDVIRDFRRPLGNPL